MCVSRIHDQYPIISRMVWQDLSGLVFNPAPARGACGMGTDQVLRAAIIKWIEQFSYQGLAFLSQLRVGIGRIGQPDDSCEVQGLNITKLQHLPEGTQRK